MTSPADTEREIARTRGEIALTLDALGRKLAVRHLAEEGFDMAFYSAAGREALNRGLDAVRANPVPVALVGIGVAWLIAANTIPDERVAQARDKITGMAGDIGARAGELASGVTDKIGWRGDTGAEMSRTLGHTGNAMVDSGDARASGWLHQMADRTQGALLSARDSGGAMLDRAGLAAGDGANRIAGQVSEVYRRNPLMIGAIGIIAGALAAALLPMSRAEGRLLRDGELQRRATEVGEDAVARVREAAADTLEAAADTLKGDTPAPSSHP
jgi:hypothetical protein